MDIGELYIMSKKSHIQSIYQQVYLSVGETGTTYSKYDINNSKNTFEFKANRAFFYYIRNTDDNVFVLIGDYQGR